jgi:tape measure domain-containing protein
MTQAEYAGSMRQVRGTALRELVEGGPATAEELAEATGMPADKVAKALADMAREGLVAEEEAARYRVS